MRLGETNKPGMDQVLHYFYRTDTSIWKNMLQNSTTQTYSLLKVAKFLSSSNMMRSTRVRWLQGQSKSTTDIISSPVGKVVTQNHNLMMMMLLLRLRSMFLAQELMVDAYLIYGVIFGLTSSTTQKSLTNVYHP